jgi:hypothetical protein
MLAVADPLTVAWIFAVARRVEQGADVVVSRERRGASWERRGGGNDGASGAIFIFIFS